SEVIGTMVLPTVSRRLGSVGAWVLASALGHGCAWLDDRRPPVNPPLYSANAQAASRVYSPARPTVVAAVREFFGVRSSVIQPIEFPHRTHVEEGLMCTDVCHENVANGPKAGLPSVNACLICHSAIATQRPLIKKITAIAQSGLDLDWQRAYGFTP